jgi:hypothetical protein
MLSFSNLFSFRNVFDWMNETARCFGYPSDPTRAARERAREATRGYCPRWAGLAQPGRASLTPRDSPPPLWLNPLPRRLSPLWLNSSLRRLSPLWLNSGRRRAVPTSHWPWVSSQAACRRAGSPARFATAAHAGVQWGGLGLARPDADCRQHRVSRGPSDRWSRALSCARIAGPSQCGGSPASRGSGGLGDTGPSAASQLVSAPL